MLYPGDAAQVARGINGPRGGAWASFQVISRPLGLLRCGGRGLGVDGHDRPSWKANGDGTTMPPALSETCMASAGGALAVTGVQPGQLATA